MDKPLETPNDFWALLEGSGADFARLDDALDTLSQRGLQNFWGFYKILSWDSVFEDSMKYEKGGFYLSEDGIDDLGWWIVSQGKAYFDEVTSESLAEQEMLATHFREEGAAPAPAVWTASEGRRYSALNHLSLAAEVHIKRFGPFTSDIEKAILGRIYKLRDDAYAAGGH